LTTLLYVLAEDFLGGDVCQERMMSPMKMRIGELLGQLSR
jgi:hypothetical protein